MLIRKRPSKSAVKEPPDFAHWRQQRLRRRLWIRGGILLSFAILVSLDQSGRLLVPVNLVRELNGAVVTVRSVDGSNDLLLEDTSGRLFSARLHGIEVNPEDPDFQREMQRLVDEAANTRVLAIIPAHHPRAVDGALWVDLAVPAVEHHPRDRRGRFARWTHRLLDAGVAEPSLFPAPVNPSLARALADRADRRNPSIGTNPG